MVRKNYKWNISKENGEKIVNKAIYDILKDSKDDILQIEELIFALNNRTKDVNIRNNNKKKNINNFIKNVMGGLVYYIENNDDYEILKINNSIYVKLSDPSLIQINEWVLIETSDSEDNY